MIAGSSRAPSELTASRPSFWSDLRALPAPTWVLFAGTFVNRFGGFVFVFLTLYLVRHGYSAGEAGLGMASYAFGWILAGAAGGLLADRVGRRATIVLSMSGSAAAMLALWQATTLAAVLPVAVIAGFFAELYRPAAAALIADLVPAGRRVPAFAAYRLAINAGFAAGPAVGGLIADRSFSWLFVGDAASSLVFAVLALVALSPEARIPRQEEPRFALVRSIAADRRLAAVLIASALGAFAYMQSAAGLPLHVHASGLSLETFGVLMSLNGLTVVLLELPLTSLTHRLPIRPVLAGAVLLTGLGFACTGLAQSTLALGVTVLVWTFGEMIWGPNAAAYVADLAPATLRGRYQGALAMSFSSAAVVAPLLGGVLYGWEPSALWLLCGMLGVIAAAVVLASRSVARPRLQGYPQSARAWRRCTQPGKGGVRQRRGQGPEADGATDKGRPTFLAQIAMPFFAAVKPNMPINAKGENVYPSAGPYHIVSRDVGRQLVLERNRFYKGSRPANPDRIVIKVPTRPPSRFIDTRRSRAEAGRFRPKRARTARRSPYGVRIDDLDRREGAMSPSPMTLEVAGYQLAGSLRPAWRRTVGGQACRLRSRTLARSGQASRRRRATRRAETLQG